LCNSLSLKTSRLFHIIRIFLFHWILFLPFHLYSQYKSVDEFRKAIDYLETRNEVYLEIPFTDAKELSFMGSIASIDRFEGNKVYVYSNMVGFQQLINEEITYRVLVPPSMQQTIQMFKGRLKEYQWDAYPAFNDYVEMMHNFASDYPDICRLDTIGMSVNLREILVLKISDHVHDDEPEPDFFYSSTMHGDEPAGYVLMLRLIDHMLNQYGSDPQITSLVDNLQIWINPLANPDGTYNKGNHTIEDATRFNDLGIDLNRNFPDPQWGENPDGNPYQPETLSMMDFIQAVQPVLSANLHGGIEVVNYPWDTWPDLHPDDVWFQFLGRQYADMAHTIEADYMTAFNNGITNGYAYYSISGGRQDYVTYFSNGREVTLELSNAKIPPADTLPYLWEYNYRSLLNYMEQSMFGIHGIITDKNTGNPVRAKIEIPGYDSKNSFVYSDGNHGTYYRLLKEGVYDLKITADGYYDALQNNVEVLDFQEVVLDIELVALGSDIQHYAIIPESIEIFPNPFHNDIYLNFITKSPGEKVEYHILDISGREVVPQIQHQTVEGENCLKINAIGIKPGIYILQLRCKDSVFEKKIIKISL